MLARDYEADPVHTRYPLIVRLRPGAGPVRRLRAMIGRLLRSLGFRRAREQWLATLNHQQDDPDAQPLLIWGLGVDRETLRLACAGFRSLRSRYRGFVPVLVTDVADFEYFSRLGWLVEYVPTLAEPAHRYGQRKERYIAWRYRRAPAVPAAVGLAAGSRAAGALIESIVRSPAGETLRNTDQRIWDTRE